MSIEHEGSLKRAQEAPAFLVDEDRGALLNTDTKGLDAYKQQREIARRNASVHARIDNLESTMDQIKALLIEVLNK